MTSSCRQGESTTTCVDTALQESSTYISTEELASSLVIPSQEEEWSACSVLCLCREMMHRELQRGGSIVRPSCPSSLYVFQLAQKASLLKHNSDCCVTTLFHHGSDCCVTSSLYCRLFFRSRDSCLIIVVVVS
jgi:hypothetical protein